MRWELTQDRTVTPNRVRVLFSIQQYGPLVIIPILSYLFTELSDALIFFWITLGLSVPLWLLSCFLCYNHIRSEQDLVCRESVSINVEIREFEWDDGRFFRTILTYFVPFIFVTMSNQNLFALIIYYGIVSLLFAYVISSEMMYENIIFLLMGYRAARILVVVNDYMGEDVIRSIIYMGKDELNAVKNRLKRYDEHKSAKTTLTVGLFGYGFLTLCSQCQDNTNE